MTVEAMRRRRPEALEDLLSSYGRELQAAAYLILRDRVLAEDVVVETLLTAYEKAGSIRDEAALRPWLYRVAVNHALQVRRSEARIVRLAVVPERPGPEDMAAGSVTHVTLRSAVDDLPPRTRAAVVLRYYADLPVEDVAAAMGTSVNTAKTQLREALAHLRGALADAPAEARHA